MAELTIGKLAVAADVSVETIRYYQRRGLVAEPLKPSGSHRHYSVDQIDRIRFIKRAQSLGFTLDEVGALLTLDSAHTCSQTRELATRKLALIEQKIADLAAIKMTLSRLVLECNAKAAETDCPIIDVLTCGAESGRQKTQGPGPENQALVSLREAQRQ